MRSSTPGQKSEDSLLKSIDDLLASVDLKHGVRSAKGWARSRSPRGGGDQAPRNHRIGRPATVAQSGSIEVIQVPGWSGLTWLIHGFSTRTGGLSHAYKANAPADVNPRREASPPGELNLGFTQSDPEITVRENRSAFLAAAKLLSGAPRSNPAPGVGPLGDPGTYAGRNAPSEDRLVTLPQIHSSLTRRVTQSDATLRPASKGDGLMTAEPGVILGIITADCIPVLIADRKQRAVAAFHAGWRGTLKRIVENGVGRMRLEFGSRPEDLVAAIGPGIGQCCYSVGEEVRGEFESQFAYAAELFCEIYDSDPVRKKYPLLFLTARAPGHSPIGPAMHLDLIEANKRQLTDAGLAENAIYLEGECTSCRTDRFFSHRAEQGFTGRMLSVIGVR